MKTKRIFKGAFASILACVVVASLGVQLVRAQEDDATLEENKEAVLKAFCGADGKLAVCVKLPASDCHTAMRPLVDTCYEKRGQFVGGSGKEAQAFHSCFWFEFNKKYSKDVQRTDECYAIAKEAFPLQPIPPELEGKMELLNPPGSKKDNSGELGY